MLGNLSTSLRATLSKQTKTALKQARNMSDAPESSSSAVEREYEQQKQQHSDAIRVYIPPRYLILTSTTALTGLSLGVMRGGRTASLQYLAENAHRQPRTVEGWYFYKKTKNYRVMWGALKVGGREALRLGTAGLAWAALEDGFERAGGRIGGQVGDGLQRGREVGAGVVAGGLVAGICECCLLVAAYDGETDVLDRPAATRAVAACCWAGVEHWAGNGGASGSADTVAGPG